MADYDCCDPRLTTSSSLETAVSSSQALSNSTSESMWEGWTQLASPTVSQCALTEQLQQHLGGGFSSSASAKSGSSYQHDLLSSWLMSGYQTVGGIHQQQQQQAQHGGEECSGITTMYPDELSRMNICSSTSSDYHGSVASPSAVAGGGSTDASHQNLYDVMQTCGSSVQTGNSSGGPTVEVVGQSAQFLNTPPLDNDHRHLEAAAHKLDDHRKMMHATVTELRSRTSSNSPPSGLNNSYGQATLQQHLSGGQFDSSNYWASTSSTAAVTSSSPQASVCSVGGAGIRSSGHHGEDQQPNMGCDSIILHHQNHQQQHRSKKGCEGDEALFHNSVTDLTTDQMYTELHGLFGKSLETSTQHQQVALRGEGASAAAGPSYGDQLNWTQFTVSPSLSGPSAHAGGFMGMQDAADRTMFDSSTADSLNTAATHAAAAAKREELSPLSAGTAMSTVHNFTAAAAADLSGHATLPYRSSSSADPESSDMGLQRKRPLSRGTEQAGGNAVNAEDSVKRSCIVRCLWEQNIAQLQLANLPSVHHRNLWQLQSQALFGRLPSNFLMGGSSSSNTGSMDMSTAVGPALNTNGRPRARRGSATDPQSVYARHRRERINDRLKVLQHLVPNGAKVDIVTMLEEAINYVKFLQLQVRLLSSDELWIYAPTTYNGMDVSMGMHAGLLDQQA